MGWKEPTGKQLKVVKKDGECMSKAQWRYCPYWYARHDVETKKVIRFWCRLYDKEKPNGYESLPECNKEWGLSHMPTL